MPRPPHLGPALTVQAARTRRPARRGPHEDAPHDPDRTRRAARGRSRGNAPYDLDRTRRAVRDAPYETGRTKTHRTRPAAQGGPHRNAPHDADRTKTHRTARAARHMPYKAGRMRRAVRGWPRGGSLYEARRVSGERQMDAWASLTNPRPAARRPDGASPRSPAEHPAGSLLRLTTRCLGVARYERDLSGTVYRVSLR